MDLASKGDNLKLDKLISDYHDEDEETTGQVYDAGMNFGDMKVYTMGLAVNSRAGNSTYLGLYMIAYIYDMYLSIYHLFLMLLRYTTHTLAVCSQYKVIFTLTLL